MLKKIFDQRKKFLRNSSEAYAAQALELYTEDYKVVMLGAASYDDSWATYKEWLKRRIVSGEYTDGELADIYIEWVNEISDNLFSDDDSKDRIRNFWKSESYRNFDNKEEESGIFFCFAAYLDDIS